MIRYEGPQTDENLESLLERRKNCVTNLQDLRDTANTNHQDGEQPHDEYFAAVSDNTYGLELLDKKIANALQLTLFDIDELEEKKEDNTIIPNDTCA